MVFIFQFVNVVFQKTAEEGKLPMASFLTSGVTLSLIPEVSRVCPLSSALSRTQTSGSLGDGSQLPEERYWCVCDQDSHSVSFSLEWNVSRYANQEPT